MMRTGMGEEFTAGLLIGGFLLASWVDSRIGESRPEATIRRVYHALASVVLLQISVGTLALIHGAGASAALMLVAIFAVFLPALVYALLTGLWVVRAAVDLAHSIR
jgi:heme A synthase